MPPTAAVGCALQKTDGAESWRAREAATFAFGSILEVGGRLRLCVRCGWSQLSRTRGSGCAAGQCFQSSDKRLGDHTLRTHPKPQLSLPPAALQGPGVETLGQLVQSGLGFLLTALKQDPNAHVKDTTAWTIGGCAPGRMGCDRWWAAQGRPGEGVCDPGRA